MSPPPQALEWGMWVFPDLWPVWRSWFRLDAGRPRGAFGQSLPLQYRDMRDESSRHDNPDLTFDRLEIIEAGYLKHINAKAKNDS